MIISVKIKLITNAEQKATLLATMKIFNQAAQIAANAGFERKVFSRISIHHLVYYSIREKLKLTSGLTVRAIEKSSRMFIINKKKCPRINPMSSICYDDQIMRFKGFGAVNLQTVNGRLDIPIIVAGYQQAKLEKAIKVGQATLIYIQGTFYLNVSIELDVPPAEITSEIMGVDFGVVNIATDSFGEQFSGEDVEAMRVKTKKLRDELQSCGTRSAKRHLKKMSRYESNYRRTKNHQISRRIVDKAKAQHCSIAVEDLTGIGKRTRFRKAQRARMSGWSFYQLRSFIEYKSKLAGVHYETIDPRNTSRECPECGHIAKANRKTQSQFQCVACGHKENADVVGAKGIRKKGRLNRPIVTNVDPCAVATGS